MWRVLTWLAAAVLGGSVGMADILKTPGRGTLTATGRAPTVVASQRMPANAALVVTGRAPVAVWSQKVPLTASLSLTGHRLSTLTTADLEDPGTSSTLYTETFESGSTLATLGWTDIYGAANTTAVGNPGYGLKNSSTYGEAQTPPITPAPIDEAYGHAPGHRYDGWVEFDWDASDTSAAPSGWSLVSIDGSGSSTYNTAWWLYAMVDANGRGLQLWRYGWVSGEDTIVLMASASDVVALSTWQTVRVEWKTSTFEVPAEANDWDGVVNPDGQVFVYLDGTLVLWATDQYILTGWGPNVAPYTYENAGHWDVFQFGPMGVIDNISAGHWLPTPTSSFYDCGPPALTPEDLCDKVHVLAWLEWDVTPGTTLTWES